MEKDPTDLGARRKIAKTLAAKLVKAAKITQAPVSLQKVIEHLQATHDITVHRVAFGEKVSGLLVTCKNVDSEYSTIGFNSAHPWCRRRFTIAHEIGHLLFNHACSGKDSDGSHNEEEANIFAGELLIPTEFIKKDYPKIKDLQEVAKLYRVSQEALTYKLMDARLLK
jgi:Zn-dependent peptidase ImmA (M78 family)